MDWRPFLLVLLAVLIAGAGVATGFFVKDARRRKWVAGVSGVLVLAVMLAAWLLPAASSDPPMLPAQGPAASGATASAAGQPPAAATSSSQAGPSVSEGFDIDARFRGASNYLAFIREVTPAAEAGDPRAQLYIYRAFEFCRAEYPYYFRDRKRDLTIDEGLRRAVTRWPNNPEFARQVHERCHDVFAEAEEEMKGSAEWLRGASRGGEPRAHALLANQLFRESVGVLSQDAREATRTEARLLLGTALRSRHPEVLQQAGDLMAMLRGDENVPESESWAWQLAACERGLGCGPDSDHVRTLCTLDGGRCQPYEGLEDLLRRHMPMQFPEIERRAREINTLIDGGEWEELGFGETTADR